MTKTTTEPIPPFRVYIGSGGSSSRTARELTKALRSNGIHVSQAKDFMGDVVEAKEVIRDAMVAVIVIGTNPLALVEGGVCLGVGVGALWVKEGDAETPLVATPMTAEQALSVLAEMTSGYQAEVATLRSSAKDLVEGVSV